jgi:hypothetical protein
MAEHMQALDSAAQVYLVDDRGEKKQAYNKKASDLRDQRKRQYGSPSK